MERHRRPPCLPPGQQVIGGACYATCMPNPLAHFAIHVDDVERARTFYTAVFGWTIVPWGPPGFYMIYPDGTEGGGPQGALHARHEPLSGTGLRAFECTFSVEDPAAIADAVEANGGEVIARDIEIPTVGTLCQFRDPDGNLCNAMKYVSH